MFNNGASTMRLLFAFPLTLALTGCGIADHFNAQGRMDQAGKDYRQCLLNNVNEPQKCEPLRQVWEAEKAAYQAGRT